MASSATVGKVPGGSAPTEDQKHALREAFGLVGYTTSPGGGVGLNSGAPIMLSPVTRVDDARTVLSGTAAVYRRATVSAAVESVVTGTPIIAGTTWYVSGTASNGFAVGNDSNSGLSKLLPKATLSAAFTAATAGDTIIMNDGVYSSAFFDLNKPIAILPWSYRGTTIRSTNASYTLYINADDITLGALVLDTNGVSGAALRSPNASAPKRNLRLYGTKLIGKTYSLYHTGTVYAYGLKVESTEGTVAWFRLDSALSGDVVIEDMVCDANVTCKPTVDGVNFVFRRNIIASKATIAQVAIDCVGPKTIVIEENETSVDVSTAGGSGIRVLPSATIPCDSVIVRNNRVRNASAAAQQAAGYGIGIGAEGATTGVISSAEVYGNDLNHVNHGLFFGFNVQRARAWGNVVRDSIIGLIIKGSASGDVIHHHNIVMGGPLTGGALRSKGSTSGKFYNNLVVWDQSSVAGGAFIQVDAATEGPTINADYANNILYAPGRAVQDAVVVTADGSTATFRHNLYFAQSFAADAFSGVASIELWKSTEPTAMNVDPLFVATPGDWRLQPGSPCIGAGTDVLGADRNFLGGAPLVRSLGPMPVAA